MLAFLPILVKFTKLGSQKWSARSRLLCTKLQIIAEHLFREGRFESAQLLGQEAHLDDLSTLQTPYQEMHAVLKQLKAGKIEAALDWVCNHADVLEGGGQVFQFKLHRVQFLRVLRTEGQLAALAYARGNLSPLAKGSLVKGFTRLMGTLLFADGPLSNSPYSEFEEEAGMEEVIQDFIRNCCGLMGQAYESPLLVSVAAGSAALPQLIKFANVMRPSSKTWQDLRTCDQLPLEVDIGNEFNFHSIFACPVSKDMSTADNPPMMLPCGHVLCKNSVQSIAKGTNVTFKCPYCPTETTPANCRVLVFPDVE